MTHDHGPGGHSHGGTDKRRVLIAAFLTAGFMVAEALGGLVTGSLALLADAGHMLTDSVSLLLAWYAFHLAGRAATARLTYGFDRVKTLVAYTNGLAVFAIGVAIVYEAWHRVNDPAPVLGGPMLVIAFLGLLVNIAAFLVLHGGDRESLNMRGAVLHVLGDLLGSAAAIVAAVVIIATGWTPIDPILSAVVAVLLFRSAWALTRESASPAARGRAGDARPRRHRPRHRGPCGRRAGGAPHACVVARRHPQHGDAACLPGRRNRAARGDPQDQAEACRDARDRPRDRRDGVWRMRRCRHSGQRAATNGRSRRTRPSSSPSLRTSMAGRLKGKIAVVTAAGQGIGRAIAEAFVAEGATVYASDLDKAKLEGLAKAKKARLDVLSTRAVEAYAEKVGPIDILVNVAGFVHHGTILDTSEKDWDFSFDLNVKSMHRTIRAFLPGMLERARQTGGSGSIVNLSSGASSLKGAPNRYAYGATKAAVIGLTKSVAADFIRQGIRANAICPGTVRSPSWEGRVEELGKSTGGTDKAMEIFVSRQPMGRVGEPAEIAALAVYLAGDESAFTTGTAIPIDGGWTL